MVDKTHLDFCLIYNYLESDCRERSNCGMVFILAVKNPFELLNLVMVKRFPFDLLLVIFGV